MKTSVYKITSKEEHEAALKEVDALMRIAEDKMTDEQIARGRLLSKAIVAYEDIHYSLPLPKTIPGMIEFKMYEMKLTQAALAQKLGFTSSTISKILNGKTEPNIHFLKAAWEKLNIPADLILKAI